MSTQHKVSFCSSSRKLPFLLMRKAPSFSAVWTDSLSFQQPCWRAFDHMKCNEAKRHTCRPPSLPKDKWDRQTNIWLNSVITMTPRKGQLHFTRLFLFYLGKASLLLSQILIPSRLNENHEEQWEANQNNPICTKLILLKSNLKILGSTKHYIIESIFFLPPYKRQTYHLR